MLADTRLVFRDTHGCTISKSYKDNKGKTNTSGKEGITRDHWCERQNVAAKWNTFVTHLTLVGIWKRNMAAKQGMLNWYR